LARANAPFGLSQFDLYKSNCLLFRWCKEGRAQIGKRRKKDVGKEGKIGLSYPRVLKV